MRKVHPVPAHSTSSAASASAAASAGGPREGHGDSSSDGDGGSRKRLDLEMASTKVAETKSAAGPGGLPAHHRRWTSGGGGVHVRNGSELAGPSLLYGHHRKSTSNVSVDTAGTADTDDMDESGGASTPRFNQERKETNSMHVARTMTTLFEEKVNRMHSTLALDPRGRFWQWWSLLVCLLYLYTIVVLPLEVPFTDVIEELFWVDVGVDLLFLVDMVLLFFVGFSDKNQGRVIMDLHTISIAYLRSWFAADLLPLLPLTAAYSISGYTSEALAVLRFLKFVRLFRVPRMLSTLRKSDPLNALEDVFGLSYAVKALFGHLCQLLALCHWLACVWCLAADAQLQALERSSWMTEYGVQNEAWTTVYLSALYWSVMTFTTIGYGDLVPTNNVERGVSIVSMILAATYYAYLVGAISTIINTSNQASHDFQALMDNLNRWLQEYNCDSPLRRRLRHFFNLSQPLLKDKYYDDVLAKMSPGLRGEFCASLYSQSLAKVEFLQPPKSISADRKTQFLGALAQRLQPHAFPAGEQLIREGDATADANSRMYIVRRGLIGARGRVVRSGGVVGEDIICRASKRWYRVMCLTFVDALTLSHADLFATLESSSDLSEQLMKVRKAANLHALQTTIREICRRVRLLKRFLRSAEAASLGLGSPREGGYKRITVRLDSDQFFDKNGDIFDPMKKVEELVQRQAEREALLTSSPSSLGSAALGSPRGGGFLRKSPSSGSAELARSPSVSSPATAAADARARAGSTLSAAGSAPGSPVTMLRRRSTAELEHKGKDRAHVVVHLSDAVNRQESVYDVLSRLDGLNLDNMAPVDALVFLDAWRRELVRIDDTLAAEASDDDNATTDGAAAAGGGGGGGGGGGSGGGGYDTGSGGARSDDEADEGEDVTAVRAAASPLPRSAMPLGLGDDSRGTRASSSDDVDVGSDGDVGSGGGGDLGSDGDLGGDGGSDGDGDGDGDGGAVAQVATAPAEEAQRSGAGSGTEITNLDGSVNNI